VQHLSLTTVGSLQLLCEQEQRKGPPQRARRAQIHRDGAALWALQGTGGLRRLLGSTEAHLLTGLPRFPGKKNCCLKAVRASLLIPSGIKVNDDGGGFSQEVLAVRPWPYGENPILTIARLAQEKAGRRRGCASPCRTEGRPGSFRVLLGVA